MTNVKNEIPLYIYIYFIYLLLLIYDPLSFRHFDIKRSKLFIVRELVYVEVLFFRHRFDIINNFRHG